LNLVDNWWKVHALYLWRKKLSIDTVPKDILKGLQKNDNGKQQINGSPIEKIDHEMIKCNGQHHTEEQS
jgi:hypothetical protein